MIQHRSLCKKDA